MSTIIGKLFLTAVATVVLAAPIVGAEAGDNRRDRPVKVDLLASGLLGSIGGTIGPDGALYVPQGATGEIMRIDVDTGQMSTFASGLPPFIGLVGVGGAFDVAFVGETAYVLVSLVGPEDFGPPALGGISTGANGIYRIDGPGTPTLIADLGAFSAANAPTAAFDYFLQGGVQYAMEVASDGFLVTDGHHNRVLHVGLDGSISVLKQYGNVVPSGLDVFRGQVFLAESGAISGAPGSYEAIGQITAFDAGDPADDGMVAAGISMAVDVQSGPGNSLYALSQGDWDPDLGPEFAGFPAVPGTGELLRVNGDGSTTTLVDGIVLPTSLHFIGGTAYIVTLTGDVWKVRGVSGAGRN
jgi:hypothetical protein